MSNREPSAYGVGPFVLLCSSRRIRGQSTFGRDVALIANHGKQKHIIWSGRPGRNACGANQIRESALARAVIRLPSIAPITNAMGAVDERTGDSPDTRAVANARIKMLPVMFAESRSWQ